jgi:hypothetical protein
MSEITEPTTTPKIARTPHEIYLSQKDTMTQWKLDHPERFKAILLKHYHKNQPRINAVNKARNKANYWWDKGRRVQLDMLCEFYP